MNAPPMDSKNQPVLLLVDDEQNILKAIKRLFRSCDYTIHTAENGSEGLALLNQEPVDLILSDMRMPKMDGAEFLAKAAEQWPNTVRILLTGYADIESTIAAVNKGKIYSYCSKPWDDNELKILVHNALEQKLIRDERNRLFAIVQDQNEQLKELNAHLEDKVEQRTGQLKISLAQIDKANKALKKQYTDSIKTFARIIEMRPGIKSGHAKFFAENGRNVARLLQLSDEEINNVMYAGLLLQIGKMSLPDELLKQPLFSLSWNDKKRYYKHAEEGQMMLKDIRQLQEAASIIYHQYEHYDGSGMPKGLVGTEIPIGSRILAVIRDYISYLDGTLTGESLPIVQVKKHIELKKGSLYDPDVSDIFFQYLPESEQDDRPVIEMSWTQLQAGMEVEEVLCNDLLYLKDRILTEKNVNDILNLRENGGQLSIKVRLGNK
ncbi:MAG TPA: two-component system response regulator [Methylococcaceae bacterium]|nr:two-component system response regulator [Methylococcaceae bacterium]